MLQKVVQKWYVDNHLGQLIFNTLGPCGTTSGATMFLND